MAKKEFIIGNKYTPRELMELAVAESHLAVPEHTDKTDPLVGAIIATKDGCSGRCANS